MTVMDGFQFGLGLILSGIFAMTMLCLILFVAAVIEDRKK